MSVRPHKVTVLVPSYNHGIYIEERITSILNQTFKDIELFVIDDCSNDSSHEVISRLQSIHGFQYIRNQKNSGTPFAAWEKVRSLGAGEFIWICESDDVAEPDFLEKAIQKLEAEPDAVLFYSSSHVIDESSAVIGHTDHYFHDIWKETRWDQDFTTDGQTELLHYQMRGQTVPNMSSALIKTSAFNAAFTPFLKRFMLTGDWLFIGDVMKHGRVVFCHDALSRFRQHQVTSRVRVKSAQSQAEFLLTKFTLFIGSGQPVRQFSTLIQSDVIRFLHEPASWLDVVKALLKISVFRSLRFFGVFVISTCFNGDLIRQFRARYRHAKRMHKS